ncbi:MAG: hypothetical protein IMW84_08930 [Thermoanaerobacter sp.]|nr:hypothetical protein [Thermoanaerobacter sp.]
MKKYTKIIALLTVMVFVLSAALTGCGGSKKRVFRILSQTVDKLSQRRYFAIGATCYKAVTKLSETEGGGRAEAMDGEGGHLRQGGRLCPVPCRSPKVEL